MKRQPQTNAPIVPAVPVFYIHPGEHPFCTNPACPCLQNEAAMRQVLEDVIDRKLQMLKVTGGTVQWRRNNGS